MPIAPHNPDFHENHPAVISHNARVGLALFLVYAALYAGFLLLTLFYPGLMSDSNIPLGPYELSLGGTNIATAYGVALILIAILLSFMYVRMTKSPGNP